MLRIPALEKLVHELTKLPGIGPKTAQRLAYYILKSKADYSESLSEALRRVSAEVHDCPECFNFTDSTICKFCSDVHRQNDVFCLVEDPSDVMRIESSGGFRGRYHVLHGALSPLDGITPDHLKIKELVQRLNKAELNGTPIKEIILALDADLEGDTTVLYITKLLQNRGIRLSRIAHGVPIGGDIDFVDDRTMNRALENRVEL
ncbi:MAG: recombination protein RecR [Deltaproteobacteria bacterium]|jgi:recombination protein RecR|nr:recombination protein RecR [Deltaproteobacteria bacterium]